MLRARFRAGYTIVEVLVFLAISSALLVSALLIFNGQDKKTQFTQSVRELDNYIADVINDVDTGYYPHNSDITCKLTGNPADPPLITDEKDNDGPGNNRECISIGKIIRFGTTEAIEVYKVVGKRFNKNVDNFDVPVSTIDEAQPVAYVEPSGNKGAELAEIKWGTKVTKLFVNGNPVDYGAFGIFSSLSSFSGSGNIVSETQRSQLVTVSQADSYELTDDTNKLIDVIIKIKNQDIVAAKDGFVLCLEDADGQRKAAITIGGSGQQLSTFSYFDDDATSRGC